jgi:hypothetical protein
MNEEERRKAEIEAQWTPKTENDIYETDPIGFSFHAKCEYCNAKLYVSQKPVFDDRLQLTIPGRLICLNGCGVSKGAWDRGQRLMNEIWSGINLQEKADEGEKQ